MRYERVEILKIFIFSPLPFILKLNKNGRNEGEMFFFRFLFFPSLVFLKKGNQNLINNLFFLLSFLIQTFEESIMMTNRHAIQLERYKTLLMNANIDTTYQHKLQSLGPKMRLIIFLSYQHR